MSNGIPKLCYIKLRNRVTLANRVFASGSTNLVKTHSEIHHPSSQQKIISRTNLPISSGRYRLKLLSEILDDWQLAQIFSFINYINTKLKLRFGVFQVCLKHLVRSTLTLILCE